jgi:hypothetical protein
MKRLSTIFCVLFLTQLFFHPLAARESAPGAVEYLSPANGTNVLPFSLYIEWEVAQASGVSYKLYLDEVNPPQTIVYDGSFTYFSPTSLSFNKTYYWKVVPYNNDGEAQDVPVWNFSTLDLASFYEEDFITDLVAPQGWQVIDHVTSGLVWQFNGVNAQITSAAGETVPAVHSSMISAAIDCSGMQGVRLYMNMSLSHGEEFSNYFAKVAVSTDGQAWQDVSVFQGNQNDFKFGWYPYYEFDISSVADNQSQVFIKFEFKNNGDGDLGWVVDKVGLKFPATQTGPAVLWSPADNSSNQPLNVELSWGKGEGAYPTGYKVYLDQNNPPQTLIYDGSSTWHSVTELEFNTQYFWKVVPYNDNGQPQDIPVWTFSTMDDVFISELPHLEDFSQAITPALPAGWSSIVITEDYYSEVKTITQWEDPFNQEPNSWPNHLRMNRSADPNGEIYLISAPVEGGMIGRRVRFYAKTTGMNSSADYIEVGTMSSPNDLWSFMSAGSVSIGQGRPVVDPDDGAEYKQYMVSFENHFTSDMYVAFRLGYTGLYGSFVYIDDIVFEEIPSEPELAVLPGNFHFGSVEAGLQSDVKHFDIINLGGGQIQVSPEDISILGENADVFLLTNISNPVTLEAFETVRISVIFSPEASGFMQAHIDVKGVIVDIAGFSVFPAITELPWLENFDQVVAPKLPLGWRGILNSDCPDVRFRTLDEAYQSSPNALNFYNGNDAGAGFYMITPQIMLDQPVDYLQLRFSAMNSTRENYLIIGTMTDPADTTTFVPLEKVYIWPEGGWYWEYAVRIPVENPFDPFHIVLKPDFYRRQRYFFIDDLYIEAAPERFTTNISVMENSSQADVIPGATIKILGHSPITTVEIQADANGSASVELAAGTYSAIVNQPGYQPEELVFEVTDQGGSASVLISHVIHPPFNLQVTTQGLEQGEALLSWNEYGEQFDFHYDNGEISGHLGIGADYQQELRTLGSAYYYYAEITDISWYLTDIGGPHEMVTLWILGLDKYGTPDLNQMLYSNVLVPNVDQQWNSYQLSEPVITPNGFYVGLGYDGFIGIASDNGSNFNMYRNFVCDHMQDAVDFVAVPFEEFAVYQNVMLRAHGYVREELEFETWPGKKLQVSAELKAKVSAPRYVGDPEVVVAKRGFNELFNVYLNSLDQPFATNINENQYLFTSLQQGTYTTFVRAITSTVASDAREISFSIGEGTNVELPNVSKIRVFPNPAINNIFVQAGEEILEIRIFNLLGKLVYQENSYSETVIINVGQLNQGIYLLQVLTSSGRVVHRIQVGK